MVKSLLNIKSFTFLPSESPPEKLLIDMITNMRISELSIIMACSEQKINDALDNTAGADIHDYLFEFSRGIDSNIHSLLARLCDVWVAKNPEQAREFLDSFEPLLA